MFLSSSPKSPSTEFWGRGSEVITCLSGAVKFFQRQREGYWRLGPANFARSKVREESTALRKKVLAKIGEGMSVRAYGQCIGCFKLVGRRKEGNSNMHDFSHGPVLTFDP